MAKDPTQRFSERAEAYTRFRPSYPPAAVDAIVEECALGRGMTVADLGSGTGKLTELLLDRGLAVVAVEPNAAMREAAERHLGRRAGFSSLATRAEATGLPDASADAVTAAQAFHWFDQDAARREVRRILRPGGRAALVWNVREEDDPFMAAYEELILTYGTERPCQGRDWSDAVAIARFFGRDVAPRLASYAQPLDWEALVGRLLSASYAPMPGEPRHEPMMASLREAFDAHGDGSFVTMRYQTHVFAGPMS